MSDENTQAAPAEGQAAPAAPIGTSAQAFFETTLPDGKKETFASREDLDRAWRESYLRRSDYTRKTQEVGNQRKQLDQERKEFEEQLKAIQEQKKKYDTYSERLKNRPDVARRLEELASGVANPHDLLQVSKGYADEKVSALEKQLQELVKEREAEKFDRTMEETYRKLETEYEDFDRKSVEDLLQELSGGNVEALSRMAYFASRGMLSPAQVEQKLATAREKKKASGMPKSGSTPQSKGKNYKSVDEALEAALRDVGDT